MTAGALQRLAWMAVLWAGLALPANAAEWSRLANVEQGRPAVRNFAPADYGSLPQNFAVAQDRRGVMYFGGVNGVLEYDGVNWRLLPTTRGTGVRSLALHSDGRIYVGGQAEFGVLAPAANGELSYLGLDLNLPEEDRDFADIWWTWSSERGVYFQSQARLFLYADGQLRSWARPNTMRRSFLVGNRLLVNDSELGLVELLDEQFMPLPYSATLSNARLISAFAIDADGQGQRILYVTDQAGLFVAEGNVLRPLDTPDHAELVATPLYNGSRLHPGLMALTSLSAGLRIIDHEGQVLRRLGRREGIRSDQVLAVSADQAGNLWLALGNGISHVQALSALSQYGEGEGVVGLVTTLARYQGRLYAGSLSGLLVLDAANGRFQPVSELSAAPVWALLPTAEGLLVGQDSGVYLLDAKGDFQLLVEIRPVMALLADRQDPDRIWVGRGNGLSTLQRVEGRWQLVAHLVQTTSFVRALAQDEQGQLWLGTEQDGIVQVRPAPGAQAGEWLTRQFGLEAGLPDVNRTSVLQTAAGVLFQQGYSTLRFDPVSERFEPAEAVAQALSGAGCVPERIMTQSRAGHLWLNCVGDEHAQIGRLVPRAEGGYRWEGEALRAVSSGSLYAVHIDVDGVVWLSTDQGLIRFDERLARDRPVPFNSLIRRVAHQDGGAHYHGVVVPGAATTRLEHTADALRFQYSATAFADPEQTRFQVWLEGQESGWSAWTGETWRDYTNLREGDYRFRVRARNADGLISHEDSYAFTIEPPWQRTPAVRAAGVALLLATITLLGLGFARLRTRRMLLANQQLDQLVQARTRELTEANAALRESQEALQRSGRRAEIIYKALNEALVGERVDDKYAIEERLGSGGFGTVYRARQLQLDTPVALKVLKPVAGQDREESLSRFRSEGAAAFRVHHPNAVAVLDFAIWMDAVAYLVMDLVEGPSLEEELRRVRRFPVGRTAALLAPICEVLATAHAVGVVHRDVKPANILLDRREGREQPRLIDFGIAKLQTTGPDHTPDLTATGLVVGTPDYMAPERISGLAYDGRSDVYSVAVIAYEMLTGVRPHFHGSGEGDSARGLRPVGTPPVSLREFGSGRNFPDELVELIESALARDPRTRPDAARMAQVLRRHADYSDEPTTESDDGSAEVRPDPGLATTPLPQQRR